MRGNVPVLSDFVIVFCATPCVGCPLRPEPLLLGLSYLSTPQRLEPTHVAGGKGGKDE